MNITDKIWEKVDTFLADHKGRQPNYLFLDICTYRKFSDERRNMFFVEEPDPERFNGIPICRVVNPKNVEIISVGA